MLPRTVARWGFARLSILAILLAAGATALIAGPLSSSGSGAVREPSLPNAPAAAFKIPKPTPLQSSADLTWWASVLSPTVARRAPGRGSAAVTSIGTLTPEDTSNLVVVLGGARSQGNEQWVDVRLSMLPANQTGWVPRRALGAYEVVDTHLVVNLRAHTATLLKDGRVIFHALVGVGRPGSPTPTGQFYIRDKLTRYHNSFYGPVAFGTSARSATLTDWPDGGYIGLHGTNQPGLIPGAISHGCVRFTDTDIKLLARLMPIGTPLTIT